MPGSGLPRISPLQRTRKIPISPVTIVTSPVGQSSLCRRATIQARMNGAKLSASSSQSMTWNVCQAVASEFGPMPAEAIAESGWTPS